MKTSEEYARLSEEALGDLQQVPGSSGLALPDKLRTAAIVYATLVQAAAIVESKRQNYHTDFIEVICNCGAVSYHPQSCQMFRLTAG